MSRPWTGDNPGSHPLLIIFAPAKINLHLHVTGKRQNGYHLLDSLVTFADIGDTLFFESANNFELVIKGPFAHMFSDADKGASPSSANSVARAAWTLARALARELNVRITLQKNMPLASGIGGGSADAAACIWGLCQFWNITLPEDYLHTLALKLGSDVPVCLKSQSFIMRGTGDELLEAPEIPELPVLLIWPGQGLPTPLVYSKLNLEGFSKNARFKSRYEDHTIFASDLSFETRNDLTSTASLLCPGIDDALSALLPADGCLLARMSGSGSTVFGLFETWELAQSTGEILRRRHPDWWIEAGWLNRIARY